MTRVRFVAYALALVTLATATLDGKPLKVQRVTTGLFGFTAGMAGLGLTAFNVWKQTLGSTKGSFADAALSGTFGAGINFGPNLGDDVTYSGTANGSTSCVADPQPSPFSCSWNTNVATPDGHMMRLGNYHDDMTGHAVARFVADACNAALKRLRVDYLDGKTTVGWIEIGYPGDSQPRGYTAAELAEKQHGVVTRAQLLALDVDQAVAA